MGGINPLRQPRERGHQKDPRQNKTPYPLHVLTHWFDGIFPFKKRYFCVTGLT
jgi:hypothetical protein